MNSINLNFLPVNIDSFVIYRKKNISKEKISNDSKIYLFFENDEKLPYIVSFIKKDDFELFKCNNTTNKNITKNYILFKIEERLEELNINYEKFYKFNQRIEIKTKEYNEGFETYIIKPYFSDLNNKIQFGIIINYKFSPKPGHERSPKTLFYSLTLDSKGFENKDYYINKYNKIKLFIENNNKLFNIPELNINKTFLNFPTHSLEIKNYLFSNNRNSNSQFMGLKNFGPYQNIQDINKTKIVFLYENKNNYAANDLYKALVGETYPNTFQGFEKIFKYKIDISEIEKYKLDNFQNFNETHFKEKINNLKRDYSNITVVALIKKNDSDLYFKLKYLACKLKISVQVVTIEQIYKNNGLKWAISNIALGIFAKLKGIPWIMSSKNNNEKIIFGFGEAHKRNNVGKIEKYLSYSISLDSSGIYKKLNVLGENSDENEYLNEFENNLNNLLLNIDLSKIKYCSLHIPRKMRNNEYKRIKSILQEHINTGISFVVIRINDKSDFFGFANNNSKVPYESSYIEISDNEYLVWFEGLQYGKENVVRRPATPLYVKFEFISDKNIENNKKEYLQELINLSGANWRGFNAKKLPISIYYPQLISRFIANIRNHFNEELDVSELDQPWFL